MYKRFVASIDIQHLTVGVDFSELMAVCEITHTFPYLINKVRPKRISSTQFNPYRYQIDMRLSYFSVFLYSHIRHKFLLIKWVLFIVQFAFAYLLNCFFYYRKNKLFCVFHFFACLICLSIHFKGIQGWYKCQVSHVAKTLISLIDGKILKTKHK